MHSIAMNNPLLNPQQLTIETALAKVAEHYPDNTALSYSDHRIIRHEELYKNLLDMRLALWHMGLGYGDRVAVIVQGNNAGATALLTLAASTVSAPMRFDLTVSEYQQLFRDLQPVALVIAKTLTCSARDAAHALAIPIIEIERNDDALSGQVSLSGDVLKRSVIKQAPQPEDSAMLLFTSGSTGKAKLVDLKHGALTIGALRTAKSLALTPSDRCLNFMPLFHVHGFVSCVLMPLISGGSTACVAPFRSDYFSAWMRSLSPTWYSTAPAIHHQILQYIKDDNACDTSSLRFVRSGSALLSSAIATNLTKTLGVPVVQAYGLSEISHVSGNPPAACKQGSVGKSVGIELAILDSEGKQLPTMQSGRIALRGEGMPSPYLQNPEANQTAFDKDWFITGDIGYLDEEDYLFLLGRETEFINRGGEKISPHEVDTILNLYPAIAQGITFAVTHPVLGEDIAAAVVAKADTELNVTALRDYLRKHLAHYKVPNRIIIVTRLPIGATGKVKRNDLASVFAKQLQQLKDSVVCEVMDHPVELQIAELWKKHLKRKHISRYDDFFALGGTSLDAMQLIIELEKQSRETMHLALLYNNPVLADFADVLIKQYSSFDRVQKINDKLVFQPPSAKDTILFDDYLATRLRTSAQQVGTKIPRAIFILCAPRSGSTLFRSMLAGHPDLFVPEELRLLHHDHLDQWQAATEGPQRIFREGVIRAVMSAFLLSQQEAQQKIAAYSTILDLYADLQQKIAPKLLVDKSPLYALDPAVLEHIEANFDQPLYIVLLRHPAAAIASFIHNHMKQLWTPEPPISEKTLGEILWNKCYSNIKHFLGNIPQDRQIRLTYENLVSNPEQQMQTICHFLGIRYDSALLTPYDGLATRMTTPDYKVSRTIGDPKFHRFNRISQTSIDLWKQNSLSASLAKETWSLASSLAYAALPALDVASDLAMIKQRIGQIVDTWQGQRFQHNRYLIADNLSGAKTPLFWCLQSEHAFNALSKALGHDQPIICMRSGHQVMDKTEHNSRLVAEWYADEIAQCISGSVAIGGNCQAGSIALFLAKALITRNIPVVRLFLLEVEIFEEFSQPLTMIFGKTSERYNPFFWDKNPWPRWSSLSSNIKLKMINCSHGQYFLPGNVKQLAGIINTQL